MLGNNQSSSIGKSEDVDDAAKLLEQGLNLLAAGQNREAMKQFWGILEKWPTHYASLSVLTRILLDTDNMNLALKIAKRSYLMDSNQANLSVLYATLLNDAHCWSDAQPVLENIVRSDHQHEEAMFQLAQSLVGQSNFRDAEIWFRKVLEVNPNHTPSCSALAKVLMQGPDYTELLKELHSRIQPQTYVEIGVDQGQSIFLSRPDTLAIGIDPAMQLMQQPASHMRLFHKTSDAFFSEHHLPDLMEGSYVDLAFIDGLHTFDQTLKDFIELERFAGPDSIYLFHDCYPIADTVAYRERETCFWTGDVWKIIPILNEYRPDLVVQTLKSAPSGLTLVTGMDPSSTVLRDNFESICDEYMKLAFPEASTNLESYLCLVDNDLEKAIDVAGCAHLKVRMEC